MDFCAFNKNKKERKKCPKLEGEGGGKVKSGQSPYFFYIFFLNLPNGKVLQQYTTSALFDSAVLFFVVAYSTMDNTTSP